MAEAAPKFLDSLTCPICLDLLKDPVAIPCGHSFCLGCIKNCWPQDDQREVYSCPHCRHTFTPRPDLKINTMLAELSEGLRRTRLQASPPAADSSAGSGGFISSTMTAAPLQKPQQFLKSPEPKTREDFLKYSCELTLDPNTAHTHLALSKRNRKATVMHQKQQYPDHPERFDGFQQILCRESLSGRCYWEVQFSISNIEIAVSYKNISRKGGYKESRFGSNDQSWSLYCCGSRFYFRHKNKETELPVVSSSSKIGVYVDHSAGILSFYSVSDTMTLLHRVHTTFTQPLYAGFRFYRDDGVLQICDLN